MNIDEFANNVLRKGKDQTINQKWHVKKLIIDGDFTGTINGLNFVDDVLHTGNWETAVVTGFKKIHTMNVSDVSTRFINGIDVENWLNHTVMINAATPQEIEGRVRLTSPVFYNDLQVDGRVNGIEFNSETVLTKSGEGQLINGDLTIRSMTPQGMKSLLIENLFLQNGINGRNVKKLYEKALKTIDTKIDSKRLVFEKPLTVKSLETSKSIFGVNMAEFQDESDRNNNFVKFHEDLEYLRHVSDDLRSSASDIAVELSHFEFHQSLQGVNIQKTVPITINVGSEVGFFLAVHERNTNTSLEVIKFYRWNRTVNNFVDDGSIQPIVFSSASFEITKFDRVFYRRVDHLFVEIFDRAANHFVQQLMALDLVNRLFVPVLDDKRSTSTEFFTLDPQTSDCVGSFSPFLPNINIVCASSPPTIIKTDPIRMVSSQNDVIILLTDDHQLQVWQQQKIRQVLKVMNPQSFASIRFEGKIYLAVTSDRVEQSIHHGSIEIFESKENEINFAVVQSFDLENPFMVQFSVIPSGDLLLYILTKNPGKALSVFKYAGASFFVESIQSSTIINTGSHLTSINIDGQTEFIAVVSNEVFIIEAVLKEF
jgi:hypothetical protein